jgi:probable HAF family extracellular repeat protein
MALIADEVRWGFAASADGRAIVGQGVFDYWLEPYLWTPETGAFSLQPTPNSSVASAAYGISADGEVVVGVHDRRAFRWSAATGFVSLGSIRLRRGCQDMNPSEVITAPHLG